MNEPATKRSFSIVHHAVRQRRLAALSLALLAFAWLACGDALPDDGTVDPPARDSGTPGDDASDAGTKPDGRPLSCLGAPFTNVEHRTDLSTEGDEQSVTLSLDEREVYVGTTHAA